MGISVVTPPDQDPVSLDEAKAHCRVTSTSEDGLIAGYVLAAREFVENDTHLRLVTQTLDYTIDDGWPCTYARGYYRTRIEFPVKPVSSVTSITYVDTNGTNQTLAADQYVVRADGAVPYIEPAYGVSWPSVRCQSAAITVRFVAGWAAAQVPNPLRQGIRWLIKHQYDTRDLITTNGTAEIPLGLEGFISPYRYSRPQ